MLTIFCHPTQQRWSSLAKLHTTINQILAETYGISPAATAGSGHWCFDIYGNYGSQIACDLMQSLLSYQCVFSPKSEFHDWLQFPSGGKVRIPKSGKATGLYPMLISQSQPSNWLYTLGIIEDYHGDPFVTRGSLNILTSPWRKFRQIPDPRPVPLPIHAGNRRHDISFWPLSCSQWLYMYFSKLLQGFSDLYIYIQYA